MKPQPEMPCETSDGRDGKRMATELEKALEEIERLRASKMLSSKRSSLGEGLTYISRNRLIPRNIPYQAHGKFPEWVGPRRLRG